MWAGRFRGPLDPEFERWQRSFPFDRRLLPQELAASAAYARALHKAGVVSDAELESLTSGLKRIAQMAAASPDFLNDSEAEDIHHFVEKHLALLCGDTGLKLHSGRSRNEQIATDMRLYVRDNIDALIASIAEFGDALLQRARQVESAVMPAYTHLQRAEPVLVAHWLLAYLEMFVRDAERLADVRKRVNVCPLGAGAIAGSTLALDRALMARELEFDGMSANSMDATSDRDFALEYVQALSVLAIHLSRWAEEMILFATQEYRFVRLPESYSTGSSAMPQKQNPDALELIRGKSGRIIGAATTLQVTIKGLPLAYNKDLQETQEPVFDASDTALALLRTATGFMGAVEFDLDRMRVAAESGWMNGMAAATYLVHKGVPFRKAHEVVGKAVQLCVERECELQELPLDELQKLSPAFGADVYEQLTVERVLACHDVAGGTAPMRVAQALEAAEERILKLGGRLHAHA